MVLVTFPTNFIKNSDEFKKGRHCTDNIYMFQSYYFKSSYLLLLLPLCPKVNAEDFCQTLMGDKGH